MSFTRFFKEHFPYIYLINVILLVVATIYFAIIGKNPLNPPIITLTVWFLMVGFIQYMVQNTFMNSIKDRGMIYLKPKELGAYYLFCLSIILILLANIVIINMFPYRITFYAIIFIDYFIGIYFEFLKLSYLYLGNLRDAFGFSNKYYLINSIRFLVLLFLLYVSNYWIVLSFVLLIPAYIILEFMLLKDLIKYESCYNE